LGQAGGRRPGHFYIEGVARTLTEPDKALKVDLFPFYTVHKRVYAGYWDYIDLKEWEKRLSEISGRTGQAQEARGRYGSYDRTRQPEE